MNATSNLTEEITLQPVCCQATVYVVEDNDNLQDGAANAHIFGVFLRQQATDPFREQTAVQLWKAKVEHSVHKNGLIMQKASFDGAI